MEDINFEESEQVDRLLNELFPNVKPTPKELFDGKIKAYKAAAYRIDEEIKAAAKKAKLAAINTMWTYEQQYKKAIEFGKAIAISEGFRNGFVIDENNKKVFELLCLYFTNDQKFEEQGISWKDENGNDRFTNYSLKKGIWLQSDTRGTGKSTLLKCFMNNKRGCYAYKHINELGTIYQKYGYDQKDGNYGLDFFLSTIPQPSSPLNFYQGQLGWMYDEIFSDSEGMVNHMGTPLFISKYLINKLYDFSDNKKSQMHKFHVTSNSDGKYIEQIAGKTFRSRMPDMFNMIKLDGNNRRI